MTLIWNQASLGVLCARCDWPLSTSSGNSRPSAIGHPTFCEARFRDRVPSPCRPIQHSGLSRAGTKRQLEPHARALARSAYMQQTLTLRSARFKPRSGARAAGSVIAVGTARVVPVGGAGVGRQAPAAPCQLNGGAFAAAWSSLPCKGRSGCSSCNARHMAGTAAHLAAHVFRPLRERQRGLSGPKQLRYFVERGCWLRRGQSKVSWWVESSVWEKRPTNRS
jgi:hypothetical protein